MFEDIQKHLRQMVAVHGECQTYFREAFPHRMRVEKIERIPAPDKDTTLYDICGIYPDLGGEQTPPNKSFGKCGTSGMTESSADSNRIRICWDSCVLIDWIKGGKEKNQMIQPVVDQLNREESPFLLYLSVLSRVEVMGGSEGMPPDTTEKLENFIGGSNVQMVAVNEQIAIKAQEIREQSMLNPKHKKLQTPDAIILATAIVLGVDALHTFDDKDLLKLNQTSIAEGLNINQCELPEGQQTPASMTFTVRLSFSGHSMPGRKSKAREGHGWLQSPAGWSPPDRRSALKRYHAKLVLESLDAVDGGLSAADLAERIRLFGQLLTDSARRAGCENVRCRVINASHSSPLGIECAVEFSPSSGLRADPIQIPAECDARPSK